MSFGLSPTWWWREGRREEVRKHPVPSHWIYYLYGWHASDSYESRQIYGKSVFFSFFFKSKELIKLVSTVIHYGHCQFVLWLNNHFFFKSIFTWPVPRCARKLFVSLKRDWTLLFSFSLIWDYNFINFVSSSGMTQEDLFRIWREEAKAALDAKKSGTVLDLWKVVAQRKVC